MHEELRMSVEGEYAFQQCFDEQSNLINECSRQHGFWDDGVDHEFGTKLMLVNTELSEAMEAFRQTGPDAVSEKPELDRLGISRVTEELADAVIRIMDIASQYDLPLGSAILAKHTYNIGRQKLHGKSC